MSEDIKVSVVVPVYNVEQYLKDCLDSLINQSLKDIEIICVNDGSTDSSLEILEDYESKDSRIKIITQENRGLSGARNTGMKYVNGKYTFFLDSDDWIAETALEELYNKSEELDLDMLFYQIEYFAQNTGEYSQSQFTSLSVIDSSFDNKIFTYEDLLDVLFKVSHAPFNKLYSTSFLNSLNAEFPEGLNYEDVVFFFKVFLKAKRTSILRKPFYFYRIRDNSISTTGKEGSFDIFKILAITNDILDDTEVLNKCFQDWLMYVIVNLKYVYLRLSKDYEDEYFKLLKENYQKFQLDKVDKTILNQWHYEDRSFYQAIEMSNTASEFDLCFNKLKFEFLAGHYKRLYEEAKAENLRLASKNSIKDRFKKIVKL